MSMPPIAPTGSMSSTEYVEYMIDYNNAAADKLAEELKYYVTQSTIDDWEAMWERIILDVDNKVTDLESATRKIKAQLTMVADAIDKL